MIERESSEESIQFDHHKADLFSQSDMQDMVMKRCIFNSNEITKLENPGATGSKS